MIQVDCSHMTFALFQLGQGARTNPCARLKWATGHLAWPAGAATRSILFMLWPNNATACVVAAFHDQRSTLVIVADRFFAASFSARYSGVSAGVIAYTGSLHSGEG